jgi:hypothetical protein
MSLNRTFTGAFAELYIENRFNLVFPNSGNFQNLDNIVVNLHISIIIILPKIWLK